MLIRTEDQNRSWKYWNLFDTETGLRYSLHYRIRDKERLNESGLRITGDVKLTIESAHSESTWRKYPMTYQGIEALDFWLQLDETSWGQKAHGEAIGVLEQIQKQEEEAALGEGLRQAALNEEDLPF